MTGFIKRASPPRYLAWEAAGLRWLGEVSGGARVVEVIDVADDRLTLEFLQQSAATPAAARELGIGLARTHAAGAPAFGAAPPGWTGDGYLGPASEPLTLALRPAPAWGEFWAAQRITPLVAECRDRGLLDREQGRMVEQVARRCAAGDFDTDDPPARIHGDLWAGNVVWTGEGAVLIDCAAHGGHRETDLAMLHLFGSPHLKTIMAGYEETTPLADGWRERVALHQLHPLLLHLRLFGTGYLGSVLTAARHYG